MASSPRAALFSIASLSELVYVADKAAVALGRPGGYLGPAVGGPDTRGPGRAETVRQDGVAEAWPSDES